MSTVAEKQEGHPAHIDQVCRVELYVAERQVECAVIDDARCLSQVFLNESSWAQMRPAAVDGARGGPYAFDSREDESDARVPLRSMTLESCEILEGGAVWLRYRLQNG